MSLRDGLKSLRASREDEKEAMPTDQRGAVAPPGVDKPADEKRETFSTRIRSSVRYALERQLLEAQEQGHKVRMEDVQEALILRYVQDAELRAGVMAGMEE